MSAKRYGVVVKIFVVPIAPKPIIPILRTWFSFVAIGLSLRITNRDLISFT